MDREIAGRLTAQLGMILSIVQILERSGQIEKGAFAAQIRELREELKQAVTSAREDDADISTLKSAIRELTEMLRRITPNGPVLRDPPDPRKGFRVIEGSADSNPDKPEQSDPS